MSNHRVPPTPLQWAAFDAALTAPLRKFRRGWAHDKAGPFHRECSIDGLAVRGLVGIGLAPGGGRRPMVRAIPQGDAR